MPDPVAHLPTITDIRIFGVDISCLTSSPCQHDCMMYFANGTLSKVRLNAPSTLYLHDNISESNILNPWGKEHFSEQMPYLSELAIKDLLSLKKHVRI